jgi:hypothetical protein
LNHFLETSQSFYCISTFDLVATAAAARTWWSSRPRCLPNHLWTESSRVSKGDGARERDPKTPPVHHRHRRRRCCCCWHCPCCFDYGCYHDGFCSWGVVVMIDCGMVAERATAAGEVVFFFFFFFSVVLW